MFTIKPGWAMLGVFMMGVVLTACGAASEAPAPNQPTAVTQSERDNEPTAAAAPLATATAIIAPAPPPTVIVGAPSGTTGATTVIPPAAAATAATAGIIPVATLTAMIADLSQRLSTSPDSITVIAAEAVTWPDGALGCPQEGMMYPQVLIEGFRAVFSVAGEEYAYHGDTTGFFVYCENPSE